MSVIMIRFLFYLLGAFLIRWFFVGRKKPPKTPEAGANPGNSASRMVKDPMCGMYMDARLAIRMDSWKEVIYFCSEECKKKYMNRSTNEGIGNNVVD
jgi:YHS domain-containing protein